MSPKRKLNRRSFLGRVGGGLLGGGALALVAGTAQAQVTDRDPTDPAGRGRGGGSGITDSDSGPGADPSGRGRGGPPRAGSTGCSDTDSGAGADPGGRGRNCTGVTDRDSGPGADPAGRGRGGGARPQSTDLPEDQRLERCANNRRRYVELAQQAAEPEGWSDETLARARTERAATLAAERRIREWQAQVGYGAGAQLDFDARYRAEQNGLASVYRSHGLSSEYSLLDLEGAIRSRIDRAVAASAQRAEVQRQLAIHQTNLIALGC